MTVLAALAIGWPAWFLPDPGEFVDRMPEALALSGVIAQGGDPLERCGAVVYRLAAPLVDAVRTRGLAALGADPLPRAVSSWRYAPWSRTPFDAEILASYTESARTWRGLDCGLGREWVAAAREAAAGPSAFYTTGRRVILLVDPAREAVIYVYYQ